jgi:hypothetical protein
MTYDELIDDKQMSLILKDTIYNLKAGKKENKPFDPRYTPAM